MKKLPGISLHAISTVVQDYKPISRVFLPLPYNHHHHLNPAKLKAFIRLDSMTDELVFQAELILKIKQKQGPAEACEKPLCCSVSTLSESEINFALPILSLDFHTHHLAFTSLV